MKEEKGASRAYLEEHRELGLKRVVVNGFLLHRLDPRHEQADFLVGQRLRKDARVDVPPQLVPGHLVLGGAAGLVESVPQELLVRLHRERAGLREEKKPNWRRARACGGGGGGNEVSSIPGSTASGGALEGERAAAGRTYRDGPKQRRLSQDLAQLVRRDVVHLCPSHTTLKQHFVPARGRRAQRSGEKVAGHSVSLLSKGAGRAEAGTLEGQGEAEPARGDTSSGERGRTSQL